MAQPMRDAGGRRFDQKHGQRIAVAGWATFAEGMGGGVDGSRRQPVMRKQPRSLSG
ncbi:MULTISPECIES: hypothetical protein [Geobacillus]|uniref:hypothetical protein n=1 Tax=Geobacillus TaxID=129337 RepID=UPI001490B40A|nr:MULTISPECIES: hypothetical protein [Geobacillus]